VVGEAADSVRDISPVVELVTWAPRARMIPRAASAVSWRISSSVSVALIASDASASARSCCTYSCSSRATSWTS
jgi:hypothetical protein